ncbi:helix-turn-helix transcriptional regulator [Streptomyces sp. SID13726]|uniref:helix-turn-helix domain-containing protein n=1 Tax=Streptomyces sp. SID13726 TaxID=2706058 RepID=UPI0013BB5C60|nr:helix-turn-helix transcriptional regulator [Streptomyces sp. SID13726]NEB00589.1 helix-turn-helix transcriptional regulator [Streptomyces sp. SID13726]
MEQAQTSRLAQDPARVRRKRVQAGLPQNQVAERVGISAAQLCRIEKGKSGASAPVLLRLAEEFGCEVADLMPPEPAVA